MENAGSKREYAALSGLREWLAKIAVRMMQSHPDRFSTEDLLRAGLDEQGREVAAMIRG